MDVLTRVPEVEDEATERTDRGPTTVPIALATMALGAAVLHAAFAPGHFGEAWSHGFFFAAVAWAQLALAVALLVRPARGVYMVGLLNIGVIAVWIVSRTWGVPIGPNSGTAEDGGFPDVLATGLEAFVVIGCAALLLRPNAWFAQAPRKWTGSHFAGVAAVGLLVAGLTTASLTPRFAGEHRHGTSAENESASGSTAADGHDHSATGTAPALTGTTPCELSGPPASEGQVLDEQGHFHRGPTEQVTLSQAETIELQRQQLLARSAAAAYPTVAAAEAAGYRKSTAYVPCIGAHYTNILLVGSFDPAKPSELLFDGTKSDSKLVGLSYLVYHPGGAPEGFAGPNDHWHQHNSNGGLCFARDGVVIGSESMTEGECKNQGGVKRELPDVWMMHDWVVPGWECSWGVFAPECPELGGRAGATAWDS